jgi:uncharacterized protein YraI
MAIGSIFGGMLQAEIAAAVRAFATEEVNVRSSPSIHCCMFACRNLMLSVRSCAV